MRIRFPSLLLVGVLCLGIGQALAGAPRFYKYNGNLPFVEMMLNMMTVMGILDKVPVNVMRDYYYSDLLGSGLPGGAGSNPWLRNAWMQRQGLAGFDAPGMNPWGTMQNPFALNMLAANPWSAGPWSASPWSAYSRGGNPWGTLPWSPPLAGAPDAWSGGVSPLSRLARSGREGGWPPGSEPDSPCVTAFCGLRPAPPAARTTTMDGLWIADNGEMLGIKRQRFLWSDGQSRYLTGKLRRSADKLIARVDGDDRVMTYQYRLQANRMVTQGPDGVVRRFVRVPVNNRL